MNKLIIYKDLEGNQMVLICTKEDFYKGVFGNGDVKVIDEIIIDDKWDLSSFPTNCPLSADF